MAQRDTAQAGLWSDTDTWVGGIIPVPGDSVVLFHAVTLDIDVTVGTGLTDRPYIVSEDFTGFSLFIAAPFEIAEDVTLSMDGDVYSIDDSVWRLGSNLVWVGTGLHRWEQYHGSGTNKHVRMEGTAEKHCSISATVGRWWMPVFSSAVAFIGDARLVSTFLDLSQNGDPTHTCGMYIHMAGFGASDPYSMTDGTITDSYQIGFPFPEDTHAASTGTVVMRRVDFDTVLVPGGQGAEYSPLRMWSLPGMTYTIDRCRFASRFAIIHPDDATIQNCVFEQGIWWTNDAESDFFAGAPLTTFEDNYIQATPGAGNMNVRHGDTVKRCWFVDQNNIDNPNFSAVRGGVGNTLIEGCIAYSAYNGVATAAGDFFNVSYAASGTTATNVVTISKCLVLPNDHGYGDANGISGTIATFSQSGNIKCSVVIENCFGYVADGNAVACGETNPMLIGTIGGFRNNLITGSGGGYKMRDLAPGSDEDAVIGSLCHHNGGFGLAEGPAHGADPANGEAYSVFPMSAPSTIGVDDVDGSDPEYVDPNRNPKTWSASLGGPGTLADVLDRLGPNGGSNVIDLTNYVLGGLTPQNAAYQGTASGGGDIGPVPVVIASSGHVLVNCMRCCRPKPNGVPLGGGA